LEGVTWQCPHHRHRHQHDGDNGDGGEAEDVGDALDLATMSFYCCDTDVGGPPLFSVFSFQFESILVQASLHPSS